MLSCSRSSRGQVHFHKYQTLLFRFLKIDSSAACPKSSCADSAIWIFARVNTLTVHQSYQIGFCMVYEFLPKWHFFKNRRLYLKNLETLVWWFFVVTCLPACLTFSTESWHQVGYMFQPIIPNLFLSILYTNMIEFCKKLLWYIYL